MKQKTVGFDRRIQLDWLDATAEWASQSMPVVEIRSRLDHLLERQIAGQGSHSARGKTITVLLHIWALVPDELRPLRDDALTLLCKRSGQDRLALHWGMCLSTYPFFRDVATATGRLLSLQGKAALSQITRRTAETWGERSTVLRAAQRIVRSLIDWQVLTETDERGVFTSAPQIEIRNGDGISAWLVEAVLSNSERRARPLANVLTDSAFFPFVVRLSSRELAHSPRLEMFRQGMDQDVVMLKTLG